MKKDQFYLLALVHVRRQSWFNEQVKTGMKTSNTVQSKSARTKNIRGRSCISHQNDTY